MMSTSVAHKHPYELCEVSTQLNKQFSIQTSLASYGVYSIPHTDLDEHMYVW